MGVTQVISTKDAGEKGSRDADGNNIESEDGREVSVARVKEGWTTFGGEI